MALGWKEGFIFFQIVCLYPSRLNLVIHLTADLLVQTKWVSLIMKNSYPFCQIVAVSHSSLSSRSCLTHTLSARRSVPRLQFSSWMVQFEGLDVPNIAHHATARIHFPQHSAQQKVDWFYRTQEYMSYCSSRFEAMFIYMEYILFIHEYIWCRYSLEAPRWGASYKYLYHMF